MAKPGRKRRVGQREPNGRLQRPSREEREAARLRREAGERATVLAQPHRRGNYDQLCASALGRFILNHRTDGRGLRRELFEAGEEYAGTVRRWRASKGIPEPFLNSARGSGTGPSDEAVERLEKRVTAMRSYVAKESGVQALKWLDIIVLDDGEIPGAVGCHAVGALTALAEHLGMITVGAHPYR